ncbi:MAG: hypothetical protein RL653_1637 [Pseudomonadota bacterium]
MRTLLLLLLAALPWNAGATTLLKMDVPSLARASDAVVRCKVVSSSSRWSRDGRRILTEVRLEVVETIAGEAGRELQVVQPGGVVGDIGQKVDGLAAFEPGEEAVLFLERRGAVHGVVGMAQGKWRVEKGGAWVRPEPVEARLVDPRTREPVPPDVARVPLDQLRATVRAARQVTP